MVEVFPVFYDPLCPGTGGSMAFSRKQSWDLEVEIDKEVRGEEVRR